MKPPEPRNDVEERFWSKVRISDDTNGCWEWTGACDRKGYGLFRWGGQYEPAHRYAYLIAYGHVLISPDHVIMHRCDNPPCVRPDHLRLGTRSENIRDCQEKNRAVVGKPKVSPETADQITELLKQGLSDMDIASKVGLSHSYVNRVRRRGHRYWRKPNTIWTITTSIEEIPADEVRPAE